MNNKENNPLVNLQRQRILITIENGEIIKARPVPNDSYIANAGNLETIVAHATPEKKLINKI